MTCLTFGDYMGLFSFYSGSKEFVLFLQDFIFHTYDSEIFFADNKMKLSAQTLEFQDTCHGFSFTFLICRHIFTSFCSGLQLSSKKKFQFQIVLDPNNPSTCFRESEQLYGQRKFNVMALWFS